MEGTERSAGRGAHLAHVLDAAPRRLPLVRPGADHAERDEPSAPGEGGAAAEAHAEEHAEEERDGEQPAQQPPDGGPLPTRIT